MKKKLSPFYVIQRMNKDKKMEYYTNYEPDEQSLFTVKTSGAMLFDSLVNVTRVAALFDDVEIRVLVTPEEMKVFFPGQMGEM